MDIQNKLDLEDSTKEFFDKFEIPEKELTLEDRELLEEVLLEDDWTLEYIKDQWCGVTATHTKVNFDTINLMQECFDKDIDYEGESAFEEDYKFRGEGNSCTIALLALYVLIYPLLEQETINWIKENLKGKDNGTGS